MPRLLNTLFAAAYVFTVLPGTATADSITLEEPDTDTRVRRVASEVRTT